MNANGAVLGAGLWPAEGMCLLPVDGLRRPSSVCVCVCVCVEGHLTLVTLCCLRACDQDSMAWDEKRFGLEYDLDDYSIVAGGVFAHVSTPYAHASVLCHLPPPHCMLHTSSLNPHIVLPLCCPVLPCAALCCPVLPHRVTHPCITVLPINQTLVAPFSGRFHHGRHGEQGPQHLQLQVRVVLPRHLHGRGH